jgi:hypothetical protein
LSEVQLDEMTLWDDVFELGNNLSRRAGKWLDVRCKTFGLLAVAADRDAKELEKLPM